MGILRTDKISGSEKPTAVTGSVSFDGNDHLEIGAAGDFNFLHNALSDWTAEFWVKTGSATRQFAFGTGASSAQVGFSIVVMSTDDDQADGTGVFAMFGRGSAGNYRYWGSNGGLTVNTWHHVAAVFKSSDKTLTLYVDGIEVDSGTGTANGTFATTDYSTSNSTFAFLVAKNEHADTFLTGEISNLRVVAGRRLYTSNFTPPVHALETINGTRILCCNNPDSVTAVSNAGIGTAHIATASGDPTVATDNPSLTRDFTYGTEFEGVTTFDTQGYFVPPSGTTEQRGRGRGLIAGGVDVPSAPSTQFNSIEYITISSMGNAQDFGDLINSITSVGSLSSPTRGIFAGGLTSPSPITYTNEIQYVTTASTGNAVDFGNLTADRRYMATCSSNTRGVFMGGEEEASPQDPTDDIKFITMATLGDAEEFGNLTDATELAAGCSSPTRGIIGGGDNPADTNRIEFITIASTGDATNFGELTEDRTSLCAGSSSTRGIFAGGRNAPTNYNIIDYITIATTGNAQDFGDLTSTINQAFNIMSNSIRGVRSGGNPNGATTLNSMEYVTIASTGNSQDFGDLIQARREHATCSDSHGGLS